MNILITSGISAFAQRAAELFPESNIFFADSNPIPSVFLGARKFFAIPSSEKTSFIHELLKLCLDLSIAKLLPLDYEELKPLAENRLLFEEYGISILVPDPENLNTIAMLVNPTRANCPKIALKEFPKEKQGVFQVVLDNEKELLKLCCLK